MLVAYALTIFLSAGLLFLVQPMVARMVLPLLGGSPAVWNTCMVFFQAVLLAGYGYSHLVTTRLRLRGQAAVHLAVLAAAALVLPLAVPEGQTPPVSEQPEWWLLGLLAVTAGLPFFVVSTTGPLLQRWFSWTGHPRASDPYFLYAASNLGSVVGLLAYPVALEPALTLRAQGWFWTAGYAALALGLVSCLALVRRGPAARATASRAAAAAADGAASASTAATRAGAAPADAAPPPATAAPGWRRRVLWLALAFVLSSLTLGVTQYVCTDLAAMPWAWVVPLLIYLLSFVVAFAPGARLPLGALGVAWLAAAAGILGLLAFGVQMPLLPILALQVAGLLLTALACHGRLAADRPAPDHLTEFYFWIAVGGVLGGAFNALAAPLLFDSVLEYPLVIALSFLLVRWPRARAARQPLLGAAAAALLLGAFLGCQAWRAGERGLTVLLRERTFFGVHLVSRTDDEWHLLEHGTTLHGTQSRHTDEKGIYWGRQPTTYFHDSGPIGDVFRVLHRQPQTRRVAVIGLGAGTLAAYAVRGAGFDFYEIDPAVARIADDLNCFSYLHDARARGAAVRTILGDGRLRLAQAANAGYGTIVLDAFTSDVVPVHLLTREAIAVYLTRLAPGGVMAFHVSNRFFDLLPVLAADARDLGLAARVRDDWRITPEQAAEQKRQSRWVLLARDEADFGALRDDPAWQPLTAPPGWRTWTDDYSNLLGVFRPGGLEAVAP
jgi:SAM-dependent methyltransferase